MNIKNIGRNDPCPCGSGKKFKQCCQNKQENQSETAKTRQLENIPTYLLKLDKRLCKMTL